MQNEWLRMNQKKIDRIQYILTEMAYKNEFQKVPIGEIRGMLGAAVVEIKLIDRILVSTLVLTLCVANENNPLGSVLLTGLGWA